MQSWRGFLIFLHALTNFQIEKHYNNKTKFKGTYLQNNLTSTMNDQAYIVNLAEYKSIGSPWIVLYVNGNSWTYFGSFHIEHTQKEIKKLIGKFKNIITNIFRI